MSRDGAAADEARRGPGQGRGGAAERGGGSDHLLLLHGAGAARPRVYSRAHGVRRAHCWTPDTSVEFGRGTGELGAGAWHSSPTYLYACLLSGTRVPLRLAAVGRV
eukprot:1944341-Rhodomonas_salina.1